MKKAIIYAVDNNFFIGAKVSLYSFLKNNNYWYNGKIIIIDININEQDKTEFKEFIYKKFDKEIQYVPVKYNNYIHMTQDNVLPRFMNTIYKLDMFSFYDYDRILFLDSDTLIIDNVKELFLLPHVDIAACKDFKAKGGKFFEERINSGILVLDKKVLNEKTYLDLLKYTTNNFSNNLPDQQPINDFFKKRISNFSPLYNYFKSIYAHKKYNKIYPFENVKIIHFYIKKPWQKEHKTEWMYDKIKPLYDLWNQYFSEISQ